MIARSRRVILAGGLTPANVRQAIDEVRPFAVDVASGVESSPGIKNHDLVRAFIEAAHSGTKGTHGTCRHQQIVRRSGLAGAIPMRAATTARSADGSCPRRSWRRSKRSSASI